MTAPFPLKKVLWSVAGFLATSTALMGFAHTKPGRPLLALLAGGRKPDTEQLKNGGGSCPLGFAKIAPSEKDALLKKQADALRGAEPARGRPALSFALDKTARADVEQWARQNQLSCTLPKAGADLDCSDVPSELLAPGHGTGPVKSVWFTFNSRDKLVALTAIRYDSDPNKAASIYSDTVSALSRNAGPPAATQGDANADYLSDGLWRQARAKFAFNDYHAQTSVTHIRQGEFMFIEEYRSLAN